MHVNEDELLSMTEDELDALPVGIIRLDRKGTILYYNRKQGELAHRETASTIGMNFFSDVAPCTAVKDFQGRFVEFLEHPGSRIKAFEFLFSFGWGKQLVTITLVRGSRDGQSIFIVVTPKKTAAG